MKTILLAILVLISLVACRQPDATVMPDVQVVGATLAAIVNSTMTARAPTPTRTPAETATPHSTTTPYPTLTPTPTLVPGQAPGYWNKYASIGDRFTFSHPHGWMIHSEDAHSVHFDIGEYTIVIIGETAPSCGNNVLFTGENAIVLNCLTEAYAADMGNTWNFKLASKGYWEDGKHRGYILEGAVRDFLFDAEGYDVVIFAPLPNGHVVTANYHCAGANCMPDKDRETLRIVLSTFKVGR